MSLHRLYLATSLAISALSLSCSDLDSLQEKKTAQPTALEPEQGETVDPEAVTEPSKTSESDQDDQNTPITSEWKPEYAKDPALYRQWVESWLKERNGEPLSESEFEDAMDSLHETKGMSLFNTEYSDCVTASGATSLAHLFDLCRPMFSASGRASDETAIHTQTTIDAMSPAVRIAYYCATFAFVHQAEVKGWLGVELYNAGNMWRSQKAYVAQDIDWYGNGSATQGQVTTAARNWYNTTLGTCPAQYGLCGVGQVDSNPSGPTLCIAAEVP